MYILFRNIVTHCLSLFLSFCQWTCTLWTLKCVKTTPPPHNHILDTFRGMWMIGENRTHKQLRSGWTQFDSIETNGMTYMCWFMYQFHQFVAVKEHLLLYSTITITISIPFALNNTIIVQAIVVNLVMLCSQIRCKPNWTIIAIIFKETFFIKDLFLNTSFVFNFRSL